MNPRRLGFFVSGFRWSGSSAVSDWLYGYDSLARPAGSALSQGEVRALNYGVQALTLVAEHRIVFGERLARWALYPDPRGWGEIFGRTLYRSRGWRGSRDRIVDTTILLLLQGKLRPRLDRYREILDEHLNSDALHDSEYLHAVRSLVAALQRMVDDGAMDVRDRTDVAAAFSRLFALFHDRLATGRGLPVFDNSIAGMNAHLHALIGTDAFDKRLIYLVHRDPRDQFAEQVKHSVRTLPYMVGKFIRDYHANVRAANALVERLRGRADASVRLVPFEEFVYSDELRAKLADEVERALTAHDLATNYESGSFVPERSRRNIGAWKRAGLDRQMARISAALSDHLRPEAD